MSSIKDFELRIKSAESTLEMLRGELEELRQQEQQEPEPLFGRWATHPEYGRGIIVSIKPDGDGEVRFAYGTSRYSDHVDTRFVLPESLDLDPVTLTTVKDFNDAPVGTIVEMMVEPKGVYVKEGSVWYGTGDVYANSARDLTKARVIRWGENDH